MELKSNSTLYVDFLGKIRICRLVRTLEQNGPDFRTSYSSWTTDFLDSTTLERNPTQGFAAPMMRHIVKPAESDPHYATAAWRNSSRVLPNKNHISDKSHISAANEMRGIRAAPRHSKHECDYKSGCAKMFKLFLRARENSHFNTRSADRDAETDHSRIESITQSIEAALTATKGEWSGLTGGSRTHWRVFR